jgi:hypothetical protein
MVSGVYRIQRATSAYLDPGLSVPPAAMQDGARRTLVSLRDHTGRNTSHPRTFSDTPRWFFWTNGLLRTSRKVLSCARAFSLRQAASTQEISRCCATPPLGYAERVRSVVPGGPLSG